MPPEYENVKFEFVNEMPIVIATVGSNAVKIDDMSVDKFADMDADAPKEFVPVIDIFEFVIPRVTPLFTMLCRVNRGYILLIATPAMTTGVIEPTPCEFDAEMEKLEDVTGY